MRAPVSRDQRHTSTHRCPVCGGADQDRRGEGKRCSGFTSTDGRWCRCSREEHAGALDRDESELFVHRIGGPCKCGIEHAPAIDPPNTIEATYDYLDEQGQLLFQVVRKTGKRFLQRRPSGTGGWNWRLGDTRRVLYRLPELLAADRARTVYVAEGEKDVDALVRHGLLATCNPGGAGKWHLIAATARAALARRDVVIVADADEPGSKHAEQVARALWGIASGVRIVELPQKDAADFFALGGDVATLEGIASAAVTWAPTPAPDAAPPSDEGSKSRGDDNEPKLKQAELVIQIVCGNAELFHDPKGAAYAVVRVGQRRAIFRLRSTAMRSWIARTVRDALGQCVGSTTIEEALVALDGIARFDREERLVHLRVAEHGGGICIDLGDETGACIEVTAQGWNVIDEAPVMFRRPEAMRPLPRPEQGGKLEDLRPFFNAADDDALYLFVAWMVAALRPCRPFPILALHGEQGTAKSTASRVARALIDPNVAPVRSAPRVEDNLAVAAQHSHVVGFDNLSGVQPWLSDALCRLATGGGLSKRTLYTDDEETVLDAIRPVVVNGIDDLANRADLAERCLVLTLRPMPKARRRDEESFWRAFSAAAPRILGVLLDGVASALRALAAVHIPELPRMADFAKWIAAAEPGLRLAPGTLLGAYERNRGHVVAATIEGSAVAMAVRALLNPPEHAGQWEGEPAHLLAALGDFAPDAIRHNKQQWPQSPRALRDDLQRLAPSLRESGIDLDLSGSKGRGPNKRRIYRLAKTQSAGATVPTVPTSPTAESAGYAWGRNADHALPHDRPHDKPGTGRDDAGTTTIDGASTPQVRENGCGERGDEGDGVAATSTARATESNDEPSAAAGKSELQEEDDWPEIPYDQLSPFQRDLFNLAGYVHGVRVVHVPTGSP